ncbi:hypothetical protein HZS_7976 [Henneguya salminicola]|nr:hypothetical protein HZS_7976 [Henneguya salminicola]
MCTTHINIHLNPTSENHHAEYIRLFIEVEINLRILLTVSIPIVIYSKVCEERGAIIINSTQAIRIAT